MTGLKRCDRCLGNLDLLNHDTEQYFLKIGAKLAGFIDTVNLISSELGALEESISGEHGLRASHALTCALDRAVEMAAHSGAGSDILGDLRRETDQLKRTLTAFKGTVSTFRILGVLTRIETARLGNAGTEFGTLADDVKSLTAEVQSRVANALDSAGLLISPIEHALQNAKNLPSVISNLSASLASFRDIQNRVQISAARLGVQYAAISDGFKRLIVSMQFHDITRQQIEHVIGMLARLCSESESSNGTISTDTRDTATIVALQSSQLADAGRKFAASVAAIEHSLDEVAAHVLAMLEESRTLSGLSADEKDSFFLKMEEGSRAILGSLGRCSEAEAANRATSGSLSETIGRMRGPIEEIQAIESQMKRMGMNARIQSAQTGAAGDALGVLAASIQQLALDSTRRSESLINVLESMSEAALHLSKEGAPASASADGGQVGYLEEMRSAVEQLHTSSERSFAQINQIVARGTSLREDLAATRRTFSVGAVFAETISRAQAMLKEVGVATGSVSSSDDGRDTARRLDDYAAHYTMQSELDVHHRITKAAARTVSRAIQAKQSILPSAESKELGDNVEFF